MSPTAPLSGRKAQAARNDQIILDSAREVFVANPSAPVAAVAEHAGVGMGALYRRYPSKDDLIRQVCSDGLNTYIAIVEAALDDDADPWASFETFMREVVAADTHSITTALAGTFTPSAELNTAAARTGELNRALLDRTRAAGVLRPDITDGDISVIFEQMAAIHVPDPERTKELRHRYLTLALDSLRNPPMTTPLPGQAPTLEERAARWSPA